MPISAAHRPILQAIDAGRPTGIVPPFATRLPIAHRPLRRGVVETLQVNLGKLCNQTCTHCHVDAGPTQRLPNMDAAAADRVIQLGLTCGTLKTVDLTGGAPEMNPHFRRIATAFCDAVIRVIDRCNLTILTEPGFSWVLDFLAKHQIDVTASLPCYTADTVDSQRGDGVFDRSIRGLQMLNAVGYGDPDGDLQLDLVYNPTGPRLPPPQSELQVAYETELRERFNIRFNRLLTITNLPIRRYATYLASRDQLNDYLRLLADHHNDSAVPGVMCRSVVSVGWDGRLYDCDFNQMIDLVDMDEEGQSPTIWNVSSLDEFAGRTIPVADHCYGCTAGAGSSCSGAITADKTSSAS